MQEIMEKRTLYGHGLWNVKIWIGLGIVFLILNTFDRSEVSSPFWFSEYILYALMIVGLWANQRYDLRKRIAIPRRLAPAAYIFLNWFFGMVYEMGLTVNGQGIGGVHQETFASFILAQGDYITIAIVSYVLIRKLRLSFREMFFVAGGKSLMEGVFMGVLIATILSPWFILTPTLIGYYTLAYSSFIALPLLFIDEELLWKDGKQGKKHSAFFFLVLGFILAWPIRIFWGLVYGPIVTRLLNLPPNVM
jgi:hypothetical protein